jgi:integrase/recombinase XerD
MAISPLRQRMIDDMTCEELTLFIGRAPETAAFEDLRFFRLHLIGSKLNIASVNAGMQALRFFFSVTLDRPEPLKVLFRVKAPRSWPQC